MMVVLTLEHVHMNRHIGRLTEALKAMMNHLSGQGPNLLVSETKFADEERSRRNVDDSPGDSLIQRGVCITEARKTFPVTKSFCKGLAKA